MIEAAAPSLSGAVARALDDYARELRRRYGEALVELRLFGSFARGEADEDSDVDVAVVLDQVDWRTRCDVIDLATDVGLPLDLRISPTVFDRSTWDAWRREERPLAMDIEREGLAL